MPDILSDDSAPDTYTHQPASINEQIRILRERGLLIKDEALARQFLEEVYFHRFLNYSVAFFAPGNHKNYRHGSSFDDIVQVYEFDSHLRLPILSAIEEIEISVRTQFINLTWKYGPHFYLNHKFFHDHKLLNDSIERIEYQLKASNELLVTDYFHRYHQPQMPPVWVALELTSIGQLSKWVANLKQEADREAIAHRYRIHHSVLFAILDNLTVIRNYAAHHARIWNRHYQLTAVIDDRHQSLSHALCDGDRIYNLLLLIVYLLKVLGNHQPFYQRLLDLLESYPVNITAMGFPENWQTMFNDVINEK